MNAALKTSLRYGLHPSLPHKLGFRALLRAVNPELARLLRATDKYTLMSGRNRTTLYRALHLALDEEIPGSFVEIGVHRGGSAAIMAHVLAERTDRKLHLFDRWGDLPQTSEEDGWRQAQYAKENIPEKLAFLAENDPLLSTRQILDDLKCANVVFWQGWFEDTFARYDGGAIAFASIDCDYYFSVKQSLDFVARHASPGCIIICDDYETWPGARKALDEFARAKRIPILRSGLGPVLVQLPLALACNDEDIALAR